MDFFKLFYVENRVILLIVAAWLIDLVIGTPRLLPQPFRFIRLLSKFTTERLLTLCGRFTKSKPQNKERYERRAGTAATLYIVLFSFIFTAVLLDCANTIHPALNYLLTIYFLYTTLSNRKLANEAYAISSLLRNGSLPQARRRLDTLSPIPNNPSLQERATPSSTSEITVVRTAVGIIAERTIDSVIAPLFYILAGALLGLPAPLAVAFTAVCVLGTPTAPSATIGTKAETTSPHSRTTIEPAFQDNSATTGSAFHNNAPSAFNRFGVRLYYAANYIPARICGILLPFAALLCAQDSRRSLWTFRRDRQNLMDLNSAQSISAFAGALRLQLGGDSYESDLLTTKPTVGDDIKEPEPDDIKAAIKLMVAASAIFVLFMGILLFQFHK